MLCVTLLWLAAGFGTGTVPCAGTVPFSGSDLAFVSSDVSSSQAGGQTTGGAGSKSKTGGDDKSTAAGKSSDSGKSTAAPNAPRKLPLDGLTEAQAKEEHWSDDPENDDPSSPLYISPDQWTHILSDVDLSDKYEKEVLKEYKVSTNKAYQDKLQKIGTYLAGIANTTQRTALWGDKHFSKFPYSFTVLQGPDVNAFSIFGGRVYVFEGLMKYVESDDELAGTLAHEISHIAFRHLATLEHEQNKLNTITLPLILIGLLTGGNGGAGLLFGSNLLNQALGSGWSTKAETAADFGGLQILEKSTYPPMGILTLMEHMARDERLGSNPNLGIFRTHPPSPERSRTLLAEMKAAGIPLKRSISSTTFRTAVKPGENESVDVVFDGIEVFAFRGDNAVTRAENASTSLNNFLDNVPALSSVSSDADGNILGDGDVLFQVTPADVPGTTTWTSSVSVAVTGVRNAVYRLNYLIWLSDG